MKILQEYWAIIIVKTLKYTQESGVGFDTQIFVLIVPVLSLKSSIIMPLTLQYEKENCHRSKTSSWPDFGKNSYKNRIKLSLKDS